MNGVWRSRHCSKRMRRPCRSSSSARNAKSNGCKHCQTKDFDGGGRKLEPLLGASLAMGRSSNRTEPTSKEIGQPHGRPHEVLSNRAPRRTAVNSAGTGACRRSVSESALSSAFCRVGPCSCPTRRVMGVLAHRRLLSFLHRLDGQCTSDRDGVVASRFRSR
jgi:hypothetical protein